MTQTLKLHSLGDGFTDRRRVEMADADLRIGAAVGDGAPPRVGNLDPDVRRVQQALNRFAPIEGGPVPKLVVDGRCGPLSRAAIRHFQLKWGLRNSVGKVVKDGIVDTEGPTIDRLRLGPALPVGNAPVQFMAELAAVGGIVTAAQGALDAARAQLVLPNPIGNGAVFAALKEHFRAHTRDEQRRTIALALKVFRRMHAAIGFVPQGWVLAIDEPPATAQGAFMFTFSGGFDPFRIPVQPGEKPASKIPTWKGLPVNSIYLCPRCRTLAPPQFRYAIVHELAHYVSLDGEIPDIDDIAYRHDSPQRYAQMTNSQAMVNADSYARFAMAAIGQPNFVFP